MFNTKGWSRQMPADIEQYLRSDRCELAKKWDGGAVLDEGDDGDAFDDDVGGWVWTELQDGERV